MELQCRVADVPTATALQLAWYRDAHRLNYDDSRGGVRYVSNVLRHSWGGVKYVSNVLRHSWGGVRYVSNVLRRNYDSKTDVK